MFDNFLPKALFLSLTVHTIFICSGLLWSNPQVKQYKKSQGVEIKYRPEVRKKMPDVKDHPVKPAQHLDLKNTPMTADGTIPLKLAKEQKALSNNFTMYERKPEHIRSSQMTHRVSITPIKSEKINNPAYAAYNEMVRDRIEAKVYENFRKMEAGSVYLTFIISSDGTLKAAQIIDEKSHGSENLKQVSINSLQQSRFPPFIKGMTLPEYSFNIEIQYQVRD